MSRLKLLEADRKAHELEARIDEGQFRERVTEESMRSATQRVGELERELSRTLADLEREKVRKERAEAEVTALKAEVASLRDSLSVAQSGLESESSARAHAQRQLVAKEAELADWVRAHSEQADRVAELERSSKDERAEIASLHELARLQREEASARVAELQAMYMKEAEFVSREEELSEQLARANAGASQTARDLKAVRIALKDANAEAEASRKRAQEQETEANLARNEVATLTSSKAALLRKLKEKDQELHEARTLFDQKDGEVSDLRNRTASTVGKLRENQRAKERASQAAREHAEALAQSEASRVALEVLVREKDLEIRTLHQREHTLAIQLAEASKTQRQFSSGGGGESNTTHVESAYSDLEARHEYLVRHHALLQEKYDRLLATISPLLGDPEFQ